MKKSNIRTVAMYIVTCGAFKGYEGYMTKIAGQTFLKNPEPTIGNWEHVFVTNSQIEFVCNIKI